jgi:hypothetical protein
MLSRGGARGVTKAELSGTLIQRTTSEAPQRRHVLHRTGRTQEAQLLDAVQTRTEGTRLGDHNRRSLNWRSRSCFARAVFDPTPQRLGFQRALCEHADRICRTCLPRVISCQRLASGIDAMRNGKHGGDCVIPIGVSPEFEGGRHERDALAWRCLSGYISVSHSNLREYAGAYMWGPGACLYLQLWSELSGTPQLVAFDESGDVRTLYPDFLRFICRQCRWRAIFPGRPANGRRFTVRAILETAQNRCQRIRAGAYRCMGRIRAFGVLRAQTDLTIGAGAAHHRLEVFAASLKRSKQRR